MASTTTERDQLQHAEVVVVRWMEALREQAGKLDEQQLENFADTGRRLVTRLSRDLGPLEIDPGALAEIQRVMIDGIGQLEDQPDMAPIDVLDDLLVRGERIRHVLRDALDADLGMAPDNARALSGALVAWLPRVPQREIAQLVGISPRQLQRWLKDGGEPSRRLWLVARLVVLLKRAWTPEGVLAWFRRPRRDLEGHAPIDVLEDPAWEQTLLGAVRQGRAQHGG
jgi:hypothetical protein